MARTIKEIYNSMVTEKNTMSSLNGLQPATDTATKLLSDLTSESKVARWRLKFWVFAVALWVHEKLFDAHKAQIEKRASELYVGSVIWYHAECFKFQFGDTLSWNGKKYIYDPIDAAKQIIKRASVTEVSGQLVIKIAKLASGVPAKLSTTEMAAFTSYIDLIKFAGTNTRIVSQDADLLKISYSIKYDPLAISATGELLSAPGTYPVEDAITKYIQNLPFDGKLSLTKLTDEIQKVPGVLDPVLGVAEAKYGTLPYSPIINEYNADAGHMTIDSVYPLRNSISYHV
jgi:hypothetical protein